MVKPFIYMYMKICLSVYYCICKNIGNKLCLKSYRTKIIIYHIIVVTKPLRTLYDLISLKTYFIRIAKLYICIVLVNIITIYVKHAHCGRFILYTHNFGEGKHCHPVACKTKMICLMFVIKSLALKKQHFYVT